MHTKEDANLANAKSDYEAKKAAATTAKNAYDAAQTDVNDKKDELDEKQATYDDAKAAYLKANAEYAALQEVYYQDKTKVSAAELAKASNELTNLKANLSKAEGDLTKAQTALSDAQNAEGDAKTAWDNASSAVSTATTNLETAQKASQDAQAAYNALINDKKNQTLEKIFDVTDQMAKSDAAGDVNAQTTIDGVTRGKLESHDYMAEQMATYYLLSQDNVDPSSIKIGSWVRDEHFAELPEVNGKANGKPYEYFTVSYKDKEGNEHVEYFNWTNDGRNEYSGQGINLKLKDGDVYIEPVETNGNYLHVSESEDGKIITTTELKYDETTKSYTMYTHTYNTETKEVGEVTSSDQTFDNVVIKGKDETTKKDIISVNGAEYTADGKVVTNVAAYLVDSKDATIAGADVEAACDEYKNPTTQAKDPLAVESAAKISEANKKLEKGFNADTYNEVYNTCAVTLAEYQVKSNNSDAKDISVKQIKGQKDAANNADLYVFEVTYTVGGEKTTEYYTVVSTVTSDYKHSNQELRAISKNENSKNWNVDKETLISADGLAEKAKETVPVKTYSDTEKALYDKILKGETDIAKNNFKGYAKPSKWGVRDEMTEAMIRLSYLNDETINYDSVKFEGWTRFTGTGSKRENLADYNYVTVTYEDTNGDKHTVYYNYRYDEENNHINIYEKQADKYYDYSYTAKNSLLNVVRDDEGRITAGSKLEYNAQTGQYSIVTYTYEYEGENIAKVSSNTETLNNTLVQDGNTYYVDGVAYSGGSYVSSTVSHKVDGTKVTGSEALSSVISSYYEQKESLNNTVNEKAALVTSANDALTEAQNTLNEKDSAYTAAKAAKETAAGNVTTAESLVNSLSKDVEAKAKTVSDKQSAYDKNAADLEKYKGNYQTALDKFEKDSADYNAIVKLYDDACAKSKTGENATIAELRDKMNAAKAERNTAYEAMQTAKTTMDNALTALNTVKGELAELRSARDTAKANYDDAVTARNTAKAEYDRINNLFVAARNDREAAKTAYEDAVSARETAEEAYNEAKEDASAKDSDLTNKITALEAAQAASEAANKQAEVVSNLKTKITEALKNLGKLKAEQMTSKEALEKAQKEVKELREALVEADEKYDGLVEAYQSKLETFLDNLRRSRSDSDSDSKKGYNPDLLALQAMALNNNLPVEVAIEDIITPLADGTQNVGLSEDGAYATNGKSSDIVLKGTDTDEILKAVELALIDDEDSPLAAGTDTADSSAKAASTDSQDKDIEITDGATPLASVSDVKNNKPWWLLGAAVVAGAGAAGYAATKKRKED